MKIDLKAEINSRLKLFLDESVRSRNLEKLNPLISSCIKEFAMREGKRIRPIFFLLAYLTYAKKKKLPVSIIQSSLAFELLHDFLLVHDDIIDNSKTRRGKPTMHRVLKSSLKLSESTCKDLSIVIGDIIYAMSIEAFLSAGLSRKIQNDALKVFLSATVLTGTGEFIDVLNGFTPINSIRLENIRLNYLLKTAQYTFKSPLVCGCIFAEAPKTEIAKMSLLGELLGEAFQIQDDLLGLFAQSGKIGKSVLSDMIEAKKTLPIFLAYKSAGLKERRFIRKCLGNKRLTIKGLERIRRIVIKTGAQAKTKAEISKLLNKSKKVIMSLNINSSQRKRLEDLMFSFIKV